MPQHDYVIDNQTAPNFRADLNNALAAIVSTNSGASQPSTTYANMMWYDTSADILKMRNETNDDWINLGTLDQAANTFAANIILASQSEAEAGTNNTKSMTPLRVAQQTTARFNATGSAPFYACRAWVNFDGTLSSGNIRGSGNVSSVTRISGGNYVVNFATAMPDENYACVGMASNRTGTQSDRLTGIVRNRSVSLTTTSAQFFSRDAENATTETQEAHIAFFR
jgi:hypothetical protein